MKIAKGDVVFEDKWLQIIEGNPNKKTKTFRVMSKCGGSVLGEVKWFSHWRHYCFFPAVSYETIHSDRCLLAISQFITKMNDEHGT